MKRYRSHKVVEAAKVIGTLGINTGWVLDDGTEIVVNEALRRRVPATVLEVIGGYYVRYADGYESWSPAKAFEEGYAPYMPLPPGVFCRCINLHQAADGTYWCCAVHAKP